ncbi:MAG: ArnT family glycosyltransferase, partial [Anaerolineae bacterium]
MNAEPQGRYWRHRLLVLALLILGFTLRFPGIGQIPPGLYHDEAQHGLDALSVLDGHLPLYFEANNGREPLFIYLVTASVAVLGRNPLAIRLPSAFVGLVTLAAIYDLARTLWRREAGLWALAVLSVTFWHVHLSRVGFRAVLLPLFTACYLSQAAKAIQRPGRTTGHWIAAGALYGASWYTYMAARFTPIAIAVIAGYGLIFHGEEMSRRWRGGLSFALAALVVLLPLGVYTLQRPDVVLARSGQVSIFNEEINGGKFWATLTHHSVATARMFVGRGDRIWRHNLAWRPVWDPALGLVFIIGVGVGLARFARDPAGALALLWTAAMALPTLLA